ncbi:hypothetical protein FisN_22Lh196 [Fistulifera solaris]|uniref:Vacuolar protein sorting-associated protein 33 n=1 Tax=Fistulifera solaris TaxID=1519565 RepID=A0A1Z5JC07_FISSO|nr:hypothetical protein FisN_22Lh196 [Fistulifera solaris]|eukprot:GAX11505.1 hypothetical protein FisN_22Lh196 [Fistulifera solaris]
MLANMDNPGIVADKESEIILPPPTPLNPLPAVSVALRLDNKEQLLTLLQSDPSAGLASSSFRQLLVFGTESLRTLLLRQVLSDPHARTFQGKKKNWDSHLFFPLPASITIVGTQILNQEHGGDETEGNVDVITYFLSPADLSQMHLVAKYIRNLKKSFRIHHRLIFLPQPSAIIHKMMKDLGLTSAPNVSIHRLQMDIYPLETDVLSIEYNEAFRECAVESTPSSLISTVARSLLKLQDVCGKIPRIQAYGPLGEEVARKLFSLTVDEYLADRDRPEEQSGQVISGGDVTALIIIDRKVDLVTPMISPLTYEGLLDDVVGIDCGFITLDVSTINPDENDNTDALKQDQVKEKKKELVSLGVNGSDTLYAEVRDQHVEKFGSFLQNQAKALRESHANFTSKDKKKDLAEIHQFVKNIPVFTQNLRSLTNHIHLAELVKHTSEETTFRERWQMERSILEGDTCYDMLDDLVACQFPPYRFFRLLCLQSLCAGGIKSSRYDSLRRDVIQTYGYEYLFILGNLEKAGLLRRRDGLWIDTTSPFNNLRKSLILINAEVDTVEPDDVSYVSSGYAPISVRLIQTAMKGWNGRDEILREIPGRIVDVEQHSPPQDLASALKTPPNKTLGALAEVEVADGVKGKKPVLIVTYVGGVTFTELAALRFLSKRPSFPYHIVCLTTKVMNGCSFLQSLS